MTVISSIKFRSRTDPLFGPEASLLIMALSFLSTAYEYCQNSLQQATLSILKQGPIPRHIGFVLDGNRRFARAHGATSTRYGHYEGFRQLEKVNYLSNSQEHTNRTLTDIGLHIGLRALHAAGSRSCNGLRF